MKVGVVGLGRMGRAIAVRLVKAGYTVFGFDPDAITRALSAQEGVHMVSELQQLPMHVDLIWLMVPQGKPVDQVLESLKPHLTVGKIIVDGGNSFYRDSQARAQALLSIGIDYLDCGTSGGVHGEKFGFCLMVGGSKKAYDRIVALLRVIAAPDGVAYIGASGAGHYVKMVHNGIEYALLQAYAEGFSIIKNGTFKDENINLEQLSDLWNHGSIIRSWILQLAHDVFKKDQDFKSVSGCVEQSGTGAWTVNEAREHKINAPLIEKALDVRAWSCETGGDYATKIVALLRNAFGGHRVLPQDKQ